jgi:hypothetical protein
MSDRTIVRSGISLGGIVFIIFLTLKILVISNMLPAENFAWLTWFWVFFPLWAGAAIIIGITLICIVIGILASIFS